MSRKMIVISSIFAMLVTLGLVIFGSYVSAHNFGAAQETRIEAKYTDLQNVLSTYNLKIQEMVQVPAMYKDDLKDVIEGSLKSRYGESGSKAVFQWLNEHQIPMDSSLYKNIQQAIEAGRNEFKMAQTTFLDIKAQYVYALKSFWKGMWLNFASYPTINIGFPKGAVDDYMIVLEEAAINSFKTGKQQAIKLR